MTREVQGAGGLWVGEFGVEAHGLVRSDAFKIDIRDVKGKRRLGTGIWVRWVGFDEQIDRFTVQVIDEDGDLAAVLRIGNIRRIGWL